MSICCLTSVFVSVGGGGQMLALNEEQVWTHARADTHSTATHPFAFSCVKGRGGGRRPMVLDFFAFSTAVSLSTFSSFKTKMHLKKTKKN